MTSQINTNGIDTNYPVPGQNNNSQGFRDNFAQIRNNLNTASAEITDLQTKAVLKAALDNSVLNNDMANTLISNASVRSFRHTTYNLGNAISGTILVDASRADYQYGAVQGNTTFQFGGWAPTNTEQTITLRLNFSNTSSVVSLPNACITTNNNYGVTQLENFKLIGNTATITAPANVTALELELSTIDCGNTISVTPVNRPFQSSQVTSRNVAPNGLIGDNLGAIAVGAAASQLPIVGANTDPYLVTSMDTTQLYPDMPIVFTGTSIDANIHIGSTYYVRNVVSNTSFTISSTIGGSNIAIGANVTGNTMFANPITNLYVAVDSYNSTAYDREILATDISGNITLGITNNLQVNAPVIFTGVTSNSNLTANTVYYIKTIDTGTGNITVSRSRTNGIAGTALTLGNSSPNGTASLTCYIGEDIWREIPLYPSVQTPNSLDAPSISNVKIGGGVNGYVLVTDGTGNLSWAAGSGSGNGTVSGSNTQIQFNNAGDFGSYAGFTFNSATNLFSVPGNAIVANNTTTANVTVTNNATIGNLAVSGNVNVATVNVTTTLTALGNVTGGNLYTNGNLSVTGNANVGNLSTVGSIFVTGTMTAGIINGTTLGVSNTAIIANLAVANVATVEGDLFSNSNIISNVFFISSVATGITSTGTTQADAAELTKQLNVVSTVPSGTGVKLPTAVTGIRVVIRNAGANTLSVYPDLGGKINTSAINAAYSLTSNNSVELFCTSPSGTGQWYTL